ncbi:unnamed protein product [Rotaria magnacalcarata]|uniref:DUF8207 domain-containing protein n=3 Tax=Rotaria magnacalcarata TaxID=392030 RepID=A0A816TL19_9BILA|nr:unnamed protein product [Rotaria magnacalcarata]
MAYVDIKQKSDLANLRTKIQKQFQNEKLGEQDVYEENVKLFEPLIKETKKINKQPTIVNVHQVPQITSSLPTNQQVPAIQQVSYSTLNLGKIASKYIQKMTIADEYDNAFGLKTIPESIDFKLGNAIVKIHQNNFKINNKTYKGTEGVWKLMITNDIKDINESDRETYKEIMLQTEGFLSEDGKVKSNRSDKYNKIIKPIYHEYKLHKEIVQKTDEINEAKKKKIVKEPEPKLAKANKKKIVKEPEPKLAKANKKKIVKEPEPEPEYESESEYDSTSADEEVIGKGLHTIFLPSDRNELVKRHQILFLEMQAGNTGVSNEFQAITDQLIKYGLLDESFFPL